MEQEMAFIPEEELRKEAVKRMELFEIASECIEAFQKGKLWMSEHGYVLPGALYEIENEEWLDTIKKIEKEKHICVYHAVHYKAIWGEVLDLLYVSAYAEDLSVWEEDRKAIKKEGYTLIYALNLSDDECSEFGGAVYIPCIGGLRKKC